MGGRLTLKSPLTQRLWHAQHGRCSVCGGQLDPALIYDPVVGWSIDHVYPRSSGRYDGGGNTLLAHVWCNVDKDNRPPTGCEILTLHAVNERLGRELVELKRHTAPPLVEPPTALRLALIEAGLVTPAP